jgi:hypothetical protein
VLLPNDEALELRDYYYKFGGGPAGVEVGPYNEGVKLERMKARVRARLEMIEEKQSACVSKLNALAGVFPSAEDTMPSKVPQRGHDPGVALKFPVAKTVVKPVPKRPMGLFAGIPRK